MTDAPTTDYHALYPAPGGDADFREGWRECIGMFSIHVVDRKMKRRLHSLLDQHCVVLEDQCIRTPTRKCYAQYEGFRAALKELCRVGAVRTPRR